MGEEWAAKGRPPRPTRTPPLPPTTPATAPAACSGLSAAVRFSVAAVAQPPTVCGTPGPVAAITAATPPRRHRCAVSGGRSGHRPAGTAVRRVAAEGGGGGSIGRDGQLGVKGSAPRDHRDPLPAAPAPRHPTGSRRRHVRTRRRTVHGRQLRGVGCCSRRVCPISAATRRSAVVGGGGDGTGGGMEEGREGSALRTKLPTPRHRQHRPPTRGPPTPTSPPPPLRPQTLPRRRLLPAAPHTRLSPARPPTPPRRRPPPTPRLPGTPDPPQFRGRRRPQNHSRRHGRPYHRHRSLSPLFAATATGTVPSFPRDLLPPQSLTPPPKPPPTSSPSRPAPATAAATTTIPPERGPSRDRHHHLDGRVERTPRRGPPAQARQQPKVGAQ